MAPQQEEVVNAGDNKVEIQAPPEEIEANDNSTEKEEDGDKKDTQRKMTVAVDAPWSARMVRSLVLCSVARLLFLLFLLFP